jgi:hypothetical protein
MLRPAHLLQHRLRGLDGCCQQLHMLGAGPVRRGASGNPGSKRAGGLVPLDACRPQQRLQLLEALAVLLPVRSSFGREVWAQLSSASVLPIAAPSCKGA